MRTHRELHVKPVGNQWTILLVGFTDGKVVSKETIPDPRYTRELFRSRDIAADRALWVSTFFTNDDATPVPVFDTSVTPAHILTRIEIPIDMGD